MHMLANIASICMHNVTLNAALGVQGGLRSDR